MSWNTLKANKDFARLLRHGQISEGTGGLLEKKAKSNNKPPQKKIKHKKQTWTFVFCPPRSNSFTSSCGAAVADISIRICGLVALSPAAKLRMTAAAWQQVSSASAWSFSEVKSMNGWKSKHTNTKGKLTNQKRAVDREAQEPLRWSGSWRATRVRDVLRCYAAVGPCAAWCPVEGKTIQKETVLR